MPQPSASPVSRPALWPVLRPAEVAALSRTLGLRPADLAARLGVPRWLLTQWIAGEMPPSTWAEPVGRFARWLAREGRAPWPDGRTAGALRLRAGLSVSALARHATLRVEAIEDWEGSERALTVWEWYALQPVLLGAHRAPSPLTLCPDGTNADLDLDPEDEDVD